MATWKRATLSSSRRRCEREGLRSIRLGECVAAFVGAQEYAALGQLSVAKQRPAASRLLDAFDRRESFHAVNNVAQHGVLRTDLKRIPVRARRGHTKHLPEGTGFSHHADPQASDVDHSKAERSEPFGHTRD
jgi:hypothetical protein